MKDYQLTGTGFVRRTRDDAYIPLGADLPEYREYLVWKSLGNTPDPATTIDDLRAAKSAEITSACMAMVDIGFDYDGNRFDSDLVSRTNIIGTASFLQTGGGLPEGFTWRTADNKNVPMDADGIVKLGAALLGHVNAQYAQSWALKAALEDATTPDQIDAIKWPSQPA